MGMIVAAVGLADVVSRGEEFVVLVRHDPERLARKSGPFPDHAAWLGQQERAVVVEDLVADGLVAYLVDDVWVDDVP